MSLVWLEWNVTICIESAVIAKELSNFWAPYFTTHLTSNHSRIGKVVPVLN
jgi:hypothetical protein